MPIDWFTVAAQALNFGVLVWLLKRFLYGPVLQAVDAREKRIADELADAAAQQAQARQEREALAQKSAQFEQQRKALFDQARAQATEQGQQWLAQARDAASAWTAKRQAKLGAQARQIDSIIRSQAQQEIFAITRQALRELADDDLEQRVCEVFSRRLHAADAALRGALAQAFEADPDALRVRSAFALGAPARRAIEGALREALGVQGPVQFLASPELVCGIELVGGGRKIGWNVADYLAAMEQRLAQQMRAQGDGADESMATPSEPLFHPGGDAIPPGGAHSAGAGSPIPGSGTPA